MKLFDFTRQGMIDLTLARQAEHKALGIPGTLRFAPTSFVFGDPRAQTVWSQSVFVYGLQNMFFTQMMGKDKNSLIHVNTDLQTKKGGTIIFESRNPMSGTGQGDDGNTTGNEESLKRRNMSLTVHERAHSYVSAGKMSEQLTATNIREDGKEDLGEWVAEALENDIAVAAWGGYNENSSGAAIETINESYPTSDRIYYGGQSAAGALGNSGADYTTDALLTAGTQTDNLAGTVIMEAIKRRCMAAIPRFRPVIVRNLSGANPDDIRSGKFNGPVLAKVMIVLMHPLQIKAIKAETGNNGYRAMVSAAQVRGNMNPIFTGAEFYWDGMLVFEYDRVPYRTGSGGSTVSEGFLLNAGRTATDDAVASARTVARAMFMGAQALCFGWAQKPEWSEDYVDNNKPKIKVDMLYGVKRTIFNAHGGSTPGSSEAIYCLDTEVLVD
jgi:N4-gp56 family major capsid protein